MSLKPNLSQIQIRPYKATDLEDVIAIYIDAIRNVASKDYSPTQISAWAHADRTIWSAKLLSRQAWVAEVDGAPAGFIDLEADGHLDRLYVHSAHNGLGVASALIRTIESAAHDLNIKRIFTEASIIARPVFEHHGYKLMTEQSIQFRGESFTNFKMEKSLDY